MRPKRYPYSGFKKHLPKIVSVSEASEIVQSAIDSCFQSYKNRKLSESRK